MYKQKLIDLLKSDEQTKQAMEKLEFGNYVIIHWTHCKVIEFNWSNLKIWNWKRYLNYKYPEHIWWNSQDKSNLEIIWLPLQERFIRMYCENNFYNNIIRFDIKMMMKYGKFLIILDAYDELFNNIKNIVIRF